MNRRELLGALALPGIFGLFLGQKTQSRLPWQEGNKFFCIKKAEVRTQVGDWVPIGTSHGIAHNNARTGEWIKVQLYGEYEGAIKWGEGMVSTNG